MGFLGSQREAIFTLICFSIARLSQLLVPEMRVLGVLALIVALGQRSAAVEEDLEQAELELEANGLSDQETNELFDPCADKFCPAGRSCVITGKGAAECQCIAQCETETDPRRRVCSNHNETWMTDCDLHRQRCLCEDDLQGCQDEMYEHLHIDYYGQCQELPKCSKEEFSDFPRRMREWLFNVMRDMSDRQILDDKYRGLEKEAEQDTSQRWTNAVVWKWCDLDGEPKDSKVSRHELFPLRAPLHTLEHCISPFLDSCDIDEDHQITLKEWAACLQLEEEDMEDMEAICQGIRESSEE